MVITFFNTLAELKDAQEEQIGELREAAQDGVLAFPIGTVTVLQFVKEIICLTFMVFAIVASVKNLGLGL